MACDAAASENFGPRSETGLNLRWASKLVVPQKDTFWVYATQVARPRVIWRPSQATAMTKESRLRSLGSIVMISISQGQSFVIESRILLVLCPVCIGHRILEVDDAHD